MAARHHLNWRYSSLMKRPMKQSGKQKMSNAKKTTQPAVLMRFATTGGSVVWQCGQRKCWAEIACGCAWGWGVSGSEPDFQLCGGT